MGSVFAIPGVNSPPGNGASRPYERAASRRSGAGVVGIGALAHPAMVMRRLMAVIMSRTRRWGDG